MAGFALHLRTAFVHDRGPGELPEALDGEKWVPGKFEETGGSEWSSTENKKTGRITSEVWIQRSAALDKLELALERQHSGVMQINVDGQEPLLIETDDGALLERLRLVHHALLHSTSQHQPVDLGPPDTALLGWLLDFPIVYSSTSPRNCLANEPLVLVSLSAGPLSLTSFSFPVRFINDASVKRVLELAKTEFAAKGIDWLETIVCLPSIAL